MARPRTAPLSGTALLVVLAVCLSAAVASVVAVPTVPLYDEFSWLVWGRELAHHVIGPHQPFVIAGGASWKPLPVLFTTIFSFFGSGAVALWLVFVRTVGLLGLWPAYRLGSRLGTSERWRAAGPMGGVLAATAVVLTRGWFGFMLGATSEPLTITAALLCVDRAIGGRRLPALTAGVALALMRPEAGVLVALYALWCLRRGRGAARRLLVVAEVLLVPVAWIAPPWLAGGSPLQAATRATQFGGDYGHALATIALTRAEHVVVAPVLVTALASVAFALWRGERPVIALALVSVAYVAVIELMTLQGFPGLGRFMLPAGAIVSVLAGAGLARLAALARGSVAPAMIAVALVSFSAPYCLPPISQVRSDRHAAAIALLGHDSLTSAVTRAGGAEGVLPCATSSATVNWRETPELAWILGVPLDRVHPVPAHANSIRSAGLAFLAPGQPALGNSPSQLGSGLRVHPLWRDGPWSIMRVTRSHDPHVDHCVGD
ncbi:MAG: hypothetical protein ACRDMX_09155 [Solirubrobacteraceae bacterium]